MQPVPDEVGVAPFGLLGCGDKRDDLLGVVPLAHGLDVHEVVRVSGKGVEHGGDAVGQKLALGLEERRGEVHEDGRPGRDDGLDVIRVDVDEAGRHIPAVRIDDAEAAGLGVERALTLDGGDAVALDHELVAKEQPVGLDDDAVPDDVQESLQSLGKMPVRALEERVDELLGVGVLRILHDLIGEAVLDHLTVEHDDGAVGQKPDDAEVVRDDHHRDAEVAAEL